MELGHGEQGNSHHLTSSVQLSVFQIDKKQTLNVSPSKGSKITMSRVLLSLTPRSNQASENLSGPCDLVFSGPSGFWVEMIQILIIFRSCGDKLGLGRF